MICIVNKKSVHGNTAALQHDTAAGSHWYWIRKIFAMQKYLCLLLITECAVAEYNSSSWMTVYTECSGVDTDHSAVLPGSWSSLLQCSVTISDQLQTLFLSVLTWHSILDTMLGWRWSMPRSFTTNSRLQFWNIQTISEVRKSCVKTCKSVSFSC